jgi:hypothetical protein
MLGGAVRGMHIHVLVLLLVVEFLAGDCSRTTVDEDEDEEESKSEMSFVSIEAIRGSISLPSWTSSFVQIPFATSASKQAAHSVTEPRASSKNFARVCRRRRPLPSAVLSNDERLARSS